MSLAWAPRPLWKWACRTLQEKGAGAEQNSWIKSHLKWLLCRVEQCQTHFLHYQRLRLLCDGQSQFFTIPPQSDSRSIASAAVYQYDCSYYIRLKKIFWAFLSGGPCVSVCVCVGGGGGVLAFGYIRCYRRNLYSWVWNSYRREKIRSSSVVYWALKPHL